MDPILQEKLLDLLINFISIVLGGGLITIIIELVNLLERFMRIPQIQTSICGARSSIDIFVLKMKSMPT